MPKQFNSYNSGPLTTIIRICDSEMIYECSYMKRSHQTHYLILVVNGRMLNGYKYSVILYFVCIIGPCCTKTVKVIFLEGNSSIYTIIDHSSSTYADIRLISLSHYR